MKKIIFILICLFGMNGQILFAQEEVRIESTGLPVDIVVPDSNIVIGEFNVIIDSLESCTFDSCWLVLHGTMSQTITNLRFNRSDHPEYNPYTFWSSIQSNHFLTLGGIYNFPPQENDTTHILFTADIGIHVLPILGSVISVSLQCIGSSLGHEEIVTNTEFGHTIMISSINSIEEFPTNKLALSANVGVIYVLDPPVRIQQCFGQLVINAQEVGTFYVPSGMYFWEKDEKHGKIVVQ